MIQQDKIQAMHSLIPRSRRIDPTRKVIIKTIIAGIFYLSHLNVANIIYSGAVVKNGLHFPLQLGVLLLINPRLKS